MIGEETLVDLLDKGNNALVGEKGYREGVEISKGIVLNNDYLMGVEASITKYMEYFSAYPDLFLDLIKPHDSTFNLYFYQRIFLRGCLRFRYHFVTACFSGDTLVKVKVKGVISDKAIKDVEVGDEVLSHLGWKKVLNPVEQYFKDDFYRFETENGEFTCTPDHLLMTSEGWLSAEEVYKMDDVTFLSVDGFYKKDILIADKVKVKADDTNIEKVYCLSVEGIPNFTLSCGVLVSNCRAFSKSFLSIIALYLECIFLPGTKRFICAPGKSQSAKIARDKIYELWDLFPLLKKEIIGEGSFQKDYVRLVFRNGSILDVVGALDTERGGRRNGGMIDELRDHDGQLLSSVVLPLMNVPRKLKCGGINEKEPNSQQLYMTSADIKTSYAYEKLIDLFESSIINPNQFFVWGCDYRVPVLHGLVDKQYINELKLSPSYNENTFIREYLSVWSGGSDESWFNFEQLSKCRKLKNPENRYRKYTEAEYFYLMSVDVGRLSDQTVCTIFRVNVKKKKYHTSLVNIFVISGKGKTKTFTNQAIEIKQIANRFSVREIVMDTNGLGIGLADEMIKYHVNDKGEELAPFGFFNDDEYKKIQPKESLQIIYSIKANAKLNSKIHSNVFTKLNTGSVSFLINEQEARVSLLATKIGQKMTSMERAMRLRPHEMTSRLFDEMANLKMKRAGIDIALERINKRYPKDKYSSFAYGLWRIKEIEEEASKKRNRFKGSRKMVFFSGG